MPWMIHVIKVNGLDSWKWKYQCKLTLLFKGKQTITKAIYNASKVDQIFYIIAFFLTVTVANQTMRDHKCLYKKNLNYMLTEKHLL